jgi:hypothetical protein
MKPKKRVEEMERQRYLMIMDWQIGNDFENK